MKPIINWPLARRMRQCCADAYLAANVTDPASGTQVLITCTGPDVVVAFRGSSEIKDWLVDFDCRMEELMWSKNDAVARVHHGFLSAFESVLADLTHAVARELTHLNFTSAQAPQLFVTGHSLGGALATLAALEFKRLKYPVAGVYTFGCPRVGNNIFAELYNEAVGDITFGFVNEGDPVPLVPTLLMGYRDCGHEVFLRRNGRVEYDPFIGLELFKDIAGMWRNWRKLELGMIPNHLLAQYKERMKTL